MFWTCQIQVLKWAFQARKPIIIPEIILNSSHSRQQLAVIFSCSYCCKKGSQQIFFSFYLCRNTETSCSQTFKLLFKFPGSIFSLISLGTSCTLGLSGCKILMILSFYFRLLPKSTATLTFPPTSWVFGDTFKTLTRERSSNRRVLPT